MATSMEGVHRKEKNISSTPQRNNNSDGVDHESMDMPKLPLRPMPNYLKPTLSSCRGTYCRYPKSQQKQTLEGPAESAAAVKHQNPVHKAHCSPSSLPQKTPAAMRSKERSTRSEAPPVAAISPRLSLDKASKTPTSTEKPLLLRKVKSLGAISTALKPHAPSSPPQRAAISPRPSFEKASKARTREKPLPLRKVKSFGTITTALKPHSPFAPPQRTPAAIRLRERSTRAETSSAAAAIPPKPSLEKTSRTTPRSGEALPLGKVRSLGTMVTALEPEEHKIPHVVNGNGTEAQGQPKCLEVEVPPQPQDSKESEDRAKDVDDLKLQRGSKVAAEGEAPRADQQGDAVLTERQEENERKEAPQACNDVIEETTIKLAARLSKVRALAGAFETVFSMQQKPEGKSKRHEQAVGESSSGGGGAAQPAGRREEMLEEEAGDRESQLERERSKDGQLRAEMATA